MKELTAAEIDVVSGGGLPLIVAIVAADAAFHAAFAGYLAAMK